MCAHRLQLCGAGLPWQPMLVNWTGCLMDHPRYSWPGHSDIPKKISTKQFTTIQRETSKTVYLPLNPEDICGIFNTYSKSFQISISVHFNCGSKTTVEFSREVESSDSVSNNYKQMDTFKLLSIFTVAGLKYNCTKNNSAVRKCERMVLLQ